MDRYKVTRDNLPMTVKSTLQTCASRLQDAKRHPEDSTLVRDLLVAVEALQLIESEIEGGPRRPEGQRSSAFTRYAIDEGDRMVMDGELRDLVVQIEDVYRRAGAT